MHMMCVSLITGKVNISLLFFVCLSLLGMRSTPFIHHLAKHTLTIRHNAAVSKDASLQKCESDAIAAAFQHVSEQIDKSFKIDLPLHVQTLVSESTCFLTQL